MKKIPVTQPFLPPLEEFQLFLETIWERKWLTNNGVYHIEFEKLLCEYLGVKYISLFSNGTLALITALKTLDVSGEVITTPYSFIATTNALFWNNILPVFVDIEPKTFNIDPEKIEDAITENTSAILPVHVYGNPCNVEAIQQIADRHGLKVIYDACHTFGVKIKDIPVLQFGDLSVMSFHATKVFNTFEGGAVICHDEKTKKKLDYLKNHGILGEQEVAEPGTNAKMNEFQAALGILQLKYVDTLIEKRKRITEIYRNEFKNIKGIICLNDIQDTKHCYSYFPVLIDAKKYGISRDVLFEKLKSKHIICRKYFYPLISRFSVYRELPSAKTENLPVASDVSDRVLCLPLYPDLEREELNRIIEVIKDV